MKRVFFEALSFLQTSIGLLQPMQDLFLSNQGPDGNMLGIVECRWLTKGPARLLLRR